MKAISLIFAIIFMSQSSFAFFGQSKDWLDLLSNEVIIEQIEALGDEIADNEHADKALRHTYKRLKVANRVLNRRYLRGQRIPNPVTDADLMGLLQDLVTNLENSSKKRFWARILIKRQIRKAIRVLENHRVVVEPPVLLAELSIISPNPLDFGNVVVGNDVLMSVVVTNNGPGVATTITTSVLEGPFSVVSNSCANIDLAQGELCTIQVLYQPLVASAEDQDILEINYFDGETDQVITNELTGTSSL